MSEATDSVDLLADLEKWQASSHGELANRQPEELFEPSFVDPYRRLQNDLWGRIFSVHGTLYTLEQLERFPLDFIYPPGEKEFWRLVVENFLEGAVVKLHGLVNDSGENVLSLGSFRTAIIKGPWLLQEMRDVFSGMLRQRGFDKLVKKIAERVDMIRDNRVAHRLVHIQSGRPKETLPRVTLQDLRACARSRSGRV